MPTLARFLAVVGLIGGIVAGGLFVLSEFFEPVPKETAASVPGVKVRK
ncbi:MAG: histidine kinase [Hyphomicrobiales bacterium]|nr:histidine kinase [Hyphomicrobiales bacterium]